jgi:hypothetical protein
MEEAWSKFSHENRHQQDIESAVLLSYGIIPFGLEYVLIIQIITLTQERFFSSRDWPLKQLGDFFLLFQLTGSQEERTDQRHLTFRKICKQIKIAR